MKVSTRISQRYFNGLLVLLTYFLTALYAITAQAQSPMYRGFEAGFGARSMKVQNVPNVGSVRADLSGGVVGVVAGNEIARAKVGLLGYYESNSGIPGTMRLYETSLGVNFYPMSILLKHPTVEPYVTGGISYDRLNFDGFYLHDEPGTINYSSTKLPNLGKVKEVNAMVGAGIAVRLVDNQHFVQLFTEVRYGYNVLSNGSRSFEGTGSTTSMMANAGLRFGMKR